MSNNSGSPSASMSGQPPPPAEGQVPPEPGAADDARSEEEERGLESAFTRDHGHPGEGIDKKEYEAARHLLPGNCPCIPCLWKSMALHTHILLLKQEIANPATSARHRNAMVVKLEKLMAIKDVEEATADRARRRAMAATQPLSGGGLGLNVPLLNSMGMFGSWLLDDDDEDDLASRNDGMPEPDGAQSPPTPPESSDGELEDSRQAYLQAAKRRRKAVNDEKEAMDVMHANYEAEHKARNAKK